MAKTSFDLKGKSVFVAGHRGMVGSALVRRLTREGVELLTVGRREVDLRDQAAVAGWFAAKRPQAVFMAAAKVGGIVANNTLRAEFIFDNLVIAANVIHAAHVNGSADLAPVALMSLLGAVVAFLAGLLALKWLSRWLEGGRWYLFGVYCLIAAAAVTVLHRAGY